MLNFTVGSRDDYSSDIYLLYFIASLWSAKLSTTLLDAYETIKEDKRFTIFNISINTKTGKFTVFRRYSEFRDLYEAVIKVNRIYATELLPKLASIAETHAPPMTLALINPFALHVHYPCVIKLDNRHSLRRSLSSPKND